MRFRTLTAAALVALTTLGLTACQSKIGEAAVVNGHRISDNELSSYVSKSGADPSTAAAAKAQGGVVEPRSQALEELIQEQVFTATLASNGGVPSDSALAAVHDQAVTAIAGSGAGGVQYDRALTRQIGAYGFTPKFATLVIHTIELEYTLVVRLKATKIADLIGAIKKAGVSVSVSGRYGRWKASKLTLVTAGSAGLPSFVSIAPTGAAATPVPAP